MNNVIDFFDCSCVEVFMGIDKDSGKLVFIFELVEGGF